jgi:hypothetical protein
MMLDEHGEFYTVIGTRPSYRRAAHIFPLPALLAPGCRFRYADGRRLTKNRLTSKKSRVELVRCIAAIIAFTSDECLES